jgi:hypothetical protein
MCEAGIAIGSRREDEVAFGAMPPSESRGCKGAIGVQGAVSGERLERGVGDGKRCGSVTRLST